MSELIPNGWTPKGVEIALDGLQEATDVIGVAITDLLAQAEADRKIAGDFIQAIYAGPAGRASELFHDLPQWIRDAIEAAPIYNEED